MFGYMTTPFTLVILIKLNCMKDEREMGKAGESWRKE
jgi:hypothetical protein